MAEQQKNAHGDKYMQGCYRCNPCAYESRARIGRRSICENVVEKGLEFILGGSYFNYSEKGCIFKLN